MSGDAFGNEDAGIDTLVDKTVDEAFNLCAVEKIPYNLLHSVDHRAYLKVKVTNKNGLHVRPLSTIVDITNTYEGEIYAKEFRKGSVANGKSMMDLMILAVTHGTDVVFCFKYDGKNNIKSSEKKAANCAYELAKLFKNNFNE